MVVLERTAAPCLIYSRETGSLDTISTTMGESIDDSDSYGRACKLVLHAYQSRHIKLQVLQVSCHR